MHYALSHREDTKYWKDVSNKSFYDNRITDDCIKRRYETKMNKENYLNSIGGHHCIGVGLRYFGYDVLKDTLLAQKETKLMMGLREKEVKKWNIICKDKPKLLQFLKDNIHKDA